MSTTLFETWPVTGEHVVWALSVAAALLLLHLLDRRDLRRRDSTTPPSVDGEEGVGGD